MILYPEYQGSPDSWETPRLPKVEERFIRELSSIGTANGVPRFRLVDASKVKDYFDGDGDLPAGEYLAYAAMVNVQRQDGFLYADGEGWKKASRASDVPSGKIALPNYSYHDFGIPRYMVEVYRCFGEPGVAESGYQWAWTVDVKERKVIDGYPVEISHYRHPGSFDLDHARQFLSILEKATKESNRLYAEQKAEAREKRLAEQKNLRQEEAAESVERIIRDIL